MRNKVIMQWIDLRSDTVTRPNGEMRETMAQAPVGDDVYGEDPTVNRLEQMVAEMTGMEAAIFAASGTQSNLLALLAHCERGDEYIVGQLAHTYRYEGGGAAVLGSIQPQPLDFEADGTLDLAKVAAYVKPDDIHFARTRLLCLENTHNGMALPMDYLAEAGKWAANNNLRLHLDGARIFNGAVYHGLPVEKLCEPFDSVSICLSKGLGAPVGSVLCGTREVVSVARRWRKVLGGGMRQAGVLAAAGIYALTNNVQRLAEDHQHAAMIASGLRKIQGVKVEYGTSQTNMVFIEVDPGSVEGLTAYCKQQGILIQGGPRIRLVTHLDISEGDIDLIVRTFKAYFKGLD